MCVGFTVNTTNGKNGTVDLRFSVPTEALMESQPDQSPPYSLPKYKHTHTCRERESEKEKLLTVCVLHRERDEGPSGEHGDILNHTLTLTCTHINQRGTEI